jgi:hypothetical protein
MFQAIIHEGVKVIEGFVVLFFNVHDEIVNRNW